MIHHVAIWVKDLELMRDFYLRYFGGQATNKYCNPKTGFESYFITFGDGTKLELMRRPDIKRHSGESGAEFLGYAHMAFSVGSVEQVDALSRQLETDGFGILSGPRRTGDGYYEGVFADPEGNRVEITA